MTPAPIDASDCACSQCRHGRPHIYPASMDDPATLRLMVERLRTERDDLLQTVDAVNALCDSAPLISVHVGSGNLVNRERYVKATDLRARLSKWRVARDG